ncbi:MAG: lipid-A-disaccharide synthase-related protein [Cyanobacteria bacterium]|nr:lipid-A-disaccharide synthase-related protein [Cyanobacteriota bacterium]
MPHRLLVLSNGHGEELIALQLMRALKARQPGLQLLVMPLVGMGSAFDRAERQGLLTRYGPRRPLPSGGFSNQSVSGLLQDLGAGLAQLSWRQWRLVRRWGQTGGPVLAVGDLLPLLLAWAGGGPYGFVGTPKSDYTWRSPPPAGWRASPLADAYHRAKGSEWDPWEWALMGRPRCRLVAVRDALTARGLRGHRVRAFAPGNPMMDGLGALPAGPGGDRPAGLAGQALTVLVALGSLPSPQQLAPLLEGAGFRPQAVPAGSGAASAWGRGPVRLLLGPHQFGPWAPLAEVGLATAGTATEQLVGLGVPALSLPGPGPQFKAGFARRQSRLLGGAVEPCHSSADLAQKLITLLDDGPRRRQLGAIGMGRMGPPGGSDRLAALVQAHLLAPTGPGGRG